MKRIGVLTFFCLFVSSGAAVGAESPTFCTAEETTYFNCVGGGGVASLCGRDDESHRYLQYRFGQAGGEPEQVVPNELDDADMGRTFHYTNIENEEEMFGRTEVWLRTLNRTYQLTYISRLDHEGRLMPKESAVLMWDGLPDGAPNVLKCARPTAGLNLDMAESLIKSIAVPGHPWSDQP